MTQDEVREILNTEITDEDWEAWSRPLSPEDEAAFQDMAPSEVLVNFIINKEKADGCLMVWDDEIQ
jgi:hypothetical protein